MDHADGEVDGGRGEGDQGDDEGGATGLDQGPMGEREGVLYGGGAGCNGDEALD